MTTTTTTPTCATCGTKFPLKSGCKCVPTKVLVKEFHRPIRIATTTKKSRAAARALKRSRVNQEGSQ